MSCRNCGAIHLDEAFVLTLTEDTGGDCRWTLSKSLVDTTYGDGDGTGEDLLYPFGVISGQLVFVKPLHLGEGSRLKDWYVTGFERSSLAV